MNQQITDIAEITRIDRDYTDRQRLRIDRDYGSAEIRQHQLFRKFSFFTKLQRE